MSSRLTKLPYDLQLLIWEKVHNHNMIEILVELLHHVQLKREVWDKEIKSAARSLIINNTWTSQRIMNRLGITTANQFWVLLIESDSGFLYDVRKTSDYRIIGFVLASGMCICEYVS